MRDRSWRRLPAAAALCALVVAAAGCSGGDGAAPAEPEETAPTSATTLPAGEGADALLDVLEAAAASRDATFAVTYDMYAPDLTGGDTGALSLTQRGEEQATRFEADGGGSGVHFISRDSGVIACALAAGRWHCYSGLGNFDAAPAVLDYGDLLRVLDAYRANQRWFSFTADTRTVAGRSATCAVGDAREDAPRDVQRRVGTQATLCVDADSGVPLLVEYTANDGGELLFRATAVSYASKADAELFDPPAPVEAGPPNVTIPVPVSGDDTAPPD